MNCQTLTRLFPRESSSKEVKVDSERRRLKTVVPRVRYVIIILYDA